MQDFRLDIIQALQIIYPDCKVELDGIFIYIKRGTLIIDRQELNRLIYFHQTGQLEDELKQIKEKGL